MTATPSRRSRRGAAMAALAVVVGLLLAPSTASALHQYCGPDAVGIGRGYPDGTSDTGFPDGDGGSYGGVAALRDASIAAFTLDRAVGATDLIESILNKAIDDPVSKGVGVGTSIAKLALTIGQVAADAVVMAHEHAIAEVDACSGTLQADMTDAIFVLLQEEELANFDAEAASAARSGNQVPPGTRAAPSGTFLLPDDNLPFQTAESGDRYDDLPGHADLEIWYQHGHADADTIGVAHTVRNDIALLEHYGLIADGRTFDARTRRYVTQPHPAKQTWHTGMDKLARGELRAAYELFIDAYQLAVNSAALK